jgi:hypothetical protein
MDNDRKGLVHGDRVIATRDVYTTQGLHIPKGAEGTVAEDRGSNLVVFFEGKDAIARLAEQDLSRVAN